jgi:hypothetical protein
MMIKTFFCLIKIKALKSATQRSLIPELQFGPKKPHLL